MMYAVLFKSSLLIVSKPTFAFLFSCQVVLVAYSMPGNWTHKDNSSLLGNDAMLGEQFSTFGAIWCLHLQDQAVLSSWIA
jgi:hypothetical protein